MDGKQVIVELIATNIEDRDEAQRLRLFLAGQDDIPLDDARLRELERAEAEASSDLMRLRSEGPALIERAMSATSEERSTLLDTIKGGILRLLNKGPSPLARIELELGKKTRTIPNVREAEAMRIDLLRWLDHRVPCEKCDPSSPERRAMFGTHPPAPLGQIQLFEAALSAASAATGAERGRLRRLILRHLEARTTVLEARSVGLYHLLAKAYAAPTHGATDADGAVGVVLPSDHAASVARQKVITDNLYGLAREKSLKLFAELGYSVEDVPPGEAPPALPPGVRVPEALWRREGAAP